MPHPGLPSLLVRSTPNAFFLRPWPAVEISHGLVVGVTTMLPSSSLLFRNSKAFVHAAANRWRIPTNRNTTLALLVVIHGCISVKRWLSHVVPDGAVHALRFRITRHCCRSSSSFFLLHLARHKGVWLDAQGPRIILTVRTAKVHGRAKSAVKGSCRCWDNCPLCRLGSPEKYSTGQFSCNDMNSCSSGQSF